MFHARLLGVLLVVVALTSCAHTLPRQTSTDPCARLSYEACADHYANEEAQAAALAGQDANARYVAIRQRWCVRAAGKIQDQVQQSDSVQQCYKTWQHFTVIPDQPVLNGQR